MSKYPKGCDGNHFEWFIVEKNIDGMLFPEVKSTQAEICRTCVYQLACADNCAGIHNGKRAKTADEMDDMAGKSLMIEAEDTTKH